MKIWVPIQSIVFFRNFVSSEALAPLAARHEVLISPAVSDLERYPLPEGLHWGPAITANIRRFRIRHAVQEFVMCGLRNRCATFKLKIYRLPSYKRLLFRLFAHPWTAALLQRLSEAVLGSDPVLDRQVREMAPDCVLIPSSCEDSLTADLIKAARKIGAQSVVLVNGWDNLTSKGTLPVLPDKLGVWGMQAKDDALRVHQVPERRIYVMGAPHFDAYLNKETSLGADADIRSFNGIPAGKKIILFGGCLQPFDEIAVLRQLDRAIADRQIPDAHILYRPHPWRHARAHEDMFEPAEFQHVSLDQQVADVYLDVKRRGNPALAKKFFPDLKYYPKLIQAAEFVISPLSTFVLESLLMGKRTIAICYSDGRHYFSADKVSQYEHVQYLQNTPGILFCRNAADLPAYCREFLEPTDQATLYARIRDHLRYIIAPNEEPYAHRLMRLVEQS